jgi:hypothetical protein
MMAANSKVIYPVKTRSAAVVVTNAAGLGILRNTPAALSRKAPAG